jgi:phosphoglycolate phosphatase-like HAD superfamily hydrolase
MVVVHRAFGLLFIIYLDDHEPAHVQIVGDGEARIAIAGPAGFPVMLTALGIRTSTKRRVMNEVLAQQDVLLAEWQQIHGECPT